MNATHSNSSVANRFGWVLVALIVALLVPVGDAQAAGFDVPFITEFGCNVVAWMKGPLAILIFIVVSVGTLVIGMIAKMDWSRIITVCVLFGIVIAIGSILSNSQYIKSVAGLSACLT